MPQMTVGIEPVQVPSTGRQRPVFQNKGPGNLFIGEDDTVTPANGFEVVVGATYEYPEATIDQIWIVADAPDTDVRMLVV